MVVLLQVALVYCFDPVTGAVSLTRFSNLSYIMLPLYAGIAQIFYLVFPLVGLFANTKFGGYNVGVSCTVVAFLSCLLLTVGLLVADYGRTEILGFVMFCIGYIVCDLAKCAFFIVMLSVGMDQLIGASGEQMSAFIHWYYWCSILGQVVSTTATCAVADVSHGVLILFGLHAMCIALILISNVVFRKFLTTEPVTSNPLKLVSAVVSYARKHKHPIRRSALTYWENDYPARLDLGKEKYGGPFTEEEVEDVKTFVRIAILLVCMMIFMINVSQFNPHLFLKHNRSKFGNCFLSSVYFSVNVTAVFMLLYLTVIYPFFYNYVPSMLRRIGIGIFLCILMEVAWISVDLVGHRGLVNETCLLKQHSNSASTHFNLNPDWLLLPRILLGLACSIAMPATLEFSVAQSPYSMRGLVVGAWFMMSGVVQSIGFNLSYPFSYIHTVQPSCGFYYYLFNLVVITFSFVLYLLLARRYKLRRREDLFNPYTAVEQYYENEFDRRDQYLKDVGADQSL